MIRESEELMRKKKEKKAKILKNVTQKWIQSHSKLDWTLNVTQNWIENRISLTIELNIEYNSKSSWKSNVA